MGNRFSYKQYLYSIFYKNFVRLHWKSRALQIDAYLKQIIEKNPFYRVVDFGCGVGSLVPIILQNDLKYLGLDPNYKFIENACQVFAIPNKVEFFRGSVEELRKILLKDDVICLNGVAHHLSDSTLADLIKISTHCRGLIILDHKMVRMTENPIAFILQKLDFGKYIRTYCYFDSLDSLVLKKRHTFSISFFGFNFWPLFIAYYEPSN